LVSSFVGPNMSTEKRVSEGAKPWGKDTLATQY